MRIAQVAPLIESVPPRLYGGTERVVSFLTEALIDLGHEVTLFASADSLTGAHLVPACTQALRLDPAITNPLPHHLIMLDQVWRLADQFDMLHFHVDLLHFPMFRAMADRTVTTLHGRLDIADLQPFYRAFPDMPLVSISQAQRRPIPDCRWIGTVHHGLPEALHRPTYASDGSLVFLGRISPEKGPARAIEIAKRSGRLLRIAAKVDAADATYFREQIAPLLDHPLIEFLGEVDEAGKADLLGRAAALLFPIDWPEPFGLAMIEAMATATPVIAFPGGAVEEVVEPDLTGFIVDTIDDAVAAVGRVDRLDRVAVRRRFEQRFTARRMAEDYVALYTRLLGRAAGALVPVTAVAA